LIQLITPYKEFDYGLCFGGQFSGPHTLITEQTSLNSLIVLVKSVLMQKKTLAILGPGLAKTDCEVPMLGSKHYLYDEQKEYLLVNFSAKNALFSLEQSTQVPTFKDLSSSLLQQLRLFYSE
jgi:hypothetical protein